MADQDTDTRAARAHGTSQDRIASVEAFQTTWRPGDAPGRRTAFVRVRTEGGLGLRMRDDEIDRRRR